MSTLKIYSETNGATATQTMLTMDEIASELHRIGVRFERWQASKPLSETSTNEEIINAYRESVDRLMKDFNFTSVDVIAMTPDHPDKAALRKKFLDEHQHSDFEVRFFIDGKGLFYLHADNRVYGVLCEKGDLLSVPANMPHWFDMGENPFVKCIRLFTTPEGWVANYTGDPIAQSFPKFEQFTNS